MTHGCSVLPAASVLLLPTHLPPQQQYTWPEFVAADLSQVSLMEALSGTSWDKTKRTMFIIEGLVRPPAPAAVGTVLLSIQHSSAVSRALLSCSAVLDLCLLPKQLLMNWLKLGGVEGDFLTCLPAQQRQCT